MFQKMFFFQNQKLIHLLLNYHKRKILNLIFQNLKILLDFFLGIKENEEPHCTIEDLKDNSYGIILLTGSFDCLFGKLFFKNLTEEIDFILNQLKNKRPKNNTKRFISAV